MTVSAPFLACSQCFSDRGLFLDAEQIGIDDPSPCPRCGSSSGRKLPAAGVGALAHRFFVWGSLARFKYGAAPLVVFNEGQKTSIKVSPWLQRDMGQIQELLGVGFFHYGPRYWMFGEVTPLLALQKAKHRASIIDRIVLEYPKKIVDTDKSFYRIRKAPKLPDKPHEYDSPPSHVAGGGRLDTSCLPVLYASPDLQVCVHECRVTAEDELYVATLAPTRPLTFLDLSVVLKEDDHITEFESLDIAVHMLFLAGKHSYGLTRAIAAGAHAAAFDGLIYPSYFSLLRLGAMPFETTYGMSHRRIPQLQEHEQAKAIPNLAIFGRPIDEGKVTVQCVNKLVINRVAYDFHFGPATIDQEA